MEGKSFPEGGGRKAYLKFSGGRQGQLFGDTRRNNNNERGGKDFLLLPEKVDTRKKASRKTRPASMPENDRLSRRPEGPLQGKIISKKPSSKKRTS